MSRMGRKPPVSFLEPGTSRPELWAEEPLVLPVSGAGRIFLPLMLALRPGEWSKLCHHCSSHALPENARTVHRDMRRMKSAVTQISSRSSVGLSCGQSHIQHHQKLSLVDLQHSDRQQGSSSHSLCTKHLIQMSILKAAVLVREHIGFSLATPLLTNGSR